MRSRKRIGPKASISWATRSASASSTNFPVTTETLLLRLLGRGEVQRKAIEELLELPQQPLTDFIREKITKLRLMLKSQPNLTTNDQETLLNIDALYEDWRNQTIQEGIAVGRQEGRHMPPPKTFVERRVELQHAIRDIESALDYMAGKERSANYHAGKRLAEFMKPQALAAEKSLAEKAVAFHEAHFHYWTAKRHLINEGIGIYGNFQSNVDDVVGLPTDNGSPMAAYFREAIENGHIKKMPVGFQA